MKREFFNNLAGQWDELPSPPDASGRVDAFVGDVIDNAPRRVLDLGCGTGILLPALLRRLPADASVVEVDFAHQMLLRNAGKSGDARVGRVCADALVPPFPAESFDLVICFNVLPHLGGHEEAMGQLWPLVRPGGRLAVGHLMSSSEVNALHASLSEAVQGDRLAPAEQVARFLEARGATKVRAEDLPGRYCAIMDKPR